MLDWGGTVHPARACRSSAPRPASSCNTLYNDKSIMGCRYGTHPPAPRHPDVRAASTSTGGCQLDEMVSQTYDLADIDQALDDMHAGKLNRGVLTL